MTPLVIAAAAVVLALPLIAFRGRTLQSAIATQAAVYLVAVMLWRQIDGQFDAYLATVVLFVAQLAVFSLFLALGEARDIRWSANRAAIIAALVYALMIPAMLRTPIDGDEPFYLLVTESVAHDRDFDLRNQYRDLAHSATGRPDLKPQVGDPVGPHGEQYSRHEPFLSLLLVPGYLIGGLFGALATIALFGVLLVRSTVRMFEDEHIDDAVTRAVFPFFAFAPPVLFYAARIWPEVPAAFCFVEAVRGVRARRAQRWVPAIIALSLLKLRFVLVAILLFLRTLRTRRNVILAVVLIGVPLALAWWATGSATAVHDWRELLPVNPRLYAIGFFGLIVDGAAGILFQAPFYLLALFALGRWRDTPGAFRIGVIASLLYILYLVPRSEWHGGWAPPLRYVAVFTPVLALGAASIWNRISRGVVALIAVWTAGLVAHGVAYPYRLFHIANGENAMGEALSAMYRTDFSRLFPSFIRPNEAAVVASVAVVAAMIVFAIWRESAQTGVSVLHVSVAALALALFFAYGLKPGSVVDFEDAHVIHNGGELYPEEYAVARFLYRGGWLLRTNDALSFLSRGGNARLEYLASAPSLIDVGGRVYHVEPTLHGYESLAVSVPAGRVTVRCVSGDVNLDRLVFAR